MGDAGRAQAPGEKGLGGALESRQAPRGLCVEGSTGLSKGRGCSRSRAKPGHSSGLLSFTQTGP